MPVKPRLVQAYTDACGVVVCPFLLALLKKKKKKEMIMFI